MRDARFAKVLGRVRSWYRNAGAGALLPGEVERDDAGPPPGMDATLRAHPEASLRLTVMMRRLGLERGAIDDRHTLRALEVTCALCQDIGDCRDWLRSKATTGHHRFCPNARQLDRLRARRK